MVIASQQNSQFYTGTGWYLLKAHKDLCVDYQETIKPWRNTPGYLKYNQRAASLLNFNSDIREDDVVLASYRDPDTDSHATEWIKIGWMSLAKRQREKEKEDKQLLREFAIPKPPVKRINNKRVGATKIENN